MIPIKKIRILSRKSDLAVIQAKQVGFKIQDNFPDINLIGSGGISCLRDIDDLKEIGLNECVVGKAYYEGKIKIHEMIYVN